MNNPRLLDALRAVAGRDLLSALRHRADLLTTLIFFVIVASLFPLGVGAETALLRTMGPGVVWVAALLASMLALARLFAGDYADGTLEQLALAPQPLSASAPASRAVNGSSSIHSLRVAHRHSRANATRRRCPWDNALHGR